MCVVFVKLHKVENGLKKCESLQLYELTMPYPKTNKSGKLNPISGITQGLVKGKGSGTRKVQEPSAGGSNFVPLTPYLLLEVNH